MTKILKKSLHTSEPLSKDLLNSIREAIIALKAVHAFIKFEEHEQDNSETNDAEEALFDIHWFFAQSIAGSYGVDAVKLLFQSAEKAGCPILGRIQQLDY